MLQENEPLPTKAIPIPAALSSRYLYSYSHALRQNGLASSPESPSFSSPNSSFIPFLADGHSQSIKQQLTHLRRSSIPRSTIDQLLPYILPYLSKRAVKEVSLVCRLWRRISLNVLYNDFSSLSSPGPLLNCDSPSSSSFGSFEDIDFPDFSVAPHSKKQLIATLAESAPFFEPSPPKTLNSMPNHLVKYVRGLNYILNSDYEENIDLFHPKCNLDLNSVLSLRKQSYDCQRQIVAHLLQYGTSIKSVHLEDVHYEKQFSLDPEVIKSLPPTITDLKIHIFRSISSPGHITNKDMFQLIDSCPQVKRLSFYLLGNSFVTIESLIQMISSWNLTYLDLNLRLDFPSRRNPLSVYEQLGQAMYGRIPHLNLCIDYFYKCRPIYAILAGISFTIENLEIKRKAKSNIYDCLNALSAPQEYLPNLKIQDPLMQPCQNIRSFKWYYDHFEDNLGQRELPQFDRFLSHCIQLEQLYINYEPNSLSFLLQSIARHCHGVKQLTLVRNIPHDDLRGLVNRIVKVKHIDLMNLVKNCPLLESLEVDSYVPASVLPHLNKITHLSFYYAEEVDSMRFGRLLSSSCDSRLRSINLTLLNTMNADNIFEMIQLGLLRGLHSFKAATFPFSESLRIRDEFSKTLVPKLSKFYDQIHHYWPSVLRLDRLQYTKVGNELYLCPGTSRRKKPVLVA